MEFIVLSVLGTALTLALLYLVVFAAVRRALFHHYKVVRWYESTGEWRPAVGHWKDAPTRIGSSLPKLK
jgi:hypothetical protein